METKEFYEKLADHLSNAPVRTPASPSGLKILAILFPKEEAELALQMPLNSSHSLAEFKEMIPEKADAMEGLLEKMEKRGTVYTSQRPGQDKKIRLFPSVVGWAETPYWGGKETEHAKDLAPLWAKYRDEAHSEELARGDMPIMRAIPIGRSLRDETQVMPYDKLEELVESTSFRAVGMCPCRGMARVNGEGCDHGDENCLHFGSIGRYMVEHDMGRELTKEETMQILKEADDEGLVHIIDNAQGQIHTICNCCGCCCAFLPPMREKDIKTLSISAYVAVVNVDDCIACGNCEDRCPMEAIVVSQEGYAVVDDSKCIGCGICTPACLEEAVRLEVRANAITPPTLGEMVQARMTAE